MFIPVRKPQLGFPCFGSRVELVTLCGCRPLDGSEDHPSGQYLWFGRKPRDSTVAEACASKETSLQSDLWCRGPADFLPRGLNF